MRSIGERARRVRVRARELVDVRARTVQRGNARKKAPPRGGAFSSRIGATFFTSAAQRDRSCVKRKEDA